MKDFEKTLYEAVFAAFGKVLAKYNAFAQGSILRDVGKEIIDYLNRYGLGFEEKGTVDDFSTLIELFVKNGFAERLDIEPADKGHTYTWHNLYGIAAYKELHEITDNPFLACPLNVCLYYLVDKHNKTMRLHRKKLDVEKGRAESQYEIIDKDMVSQEEAFDPLVIENARLYELARERADKLEKAEDLKRANEELRNTQTQLIQSAKLASIGELAAGVAHELNQPLLVIRGMVQFIRRNAAKEKMEPDELEEHLEMVERNTGRMMKVISHLRTFSRQSEPSFSSVDINKVIEDSLLMVGEQLRLRDIDVLMDLSPSLPDVKGDVNQVEQVILNLITNARDAIEAGRRHEKKAGYDPARTDRIEITTRIVEESTDRIELLVRDTGCGIPPEIGSRIFEPFFTTKEVGEGTGLGLSISYGIIREHGGEIGVVDTGPKGTTVRIRLPAIGGQG